MKKTLIYTAVSTALITIIRVLQQFFIIDANGYYVTGGIIDTVLKHSLGVAFAATAVVMIISIAKKDSEKVAPLVCEGVKSSAVISVIMTALMGADAGLRVGAAVLAKTVDAVALAELLAAVFFVIFAADLSKGRVSRASLVFGVFPPIYLVVRGITLFFQSFKKASVSSGKIEMLVLCAFALFMMSFMSARSGAAVTKKRLAAFCSLFCIYAGAFVIPEIYTALITSQSVVLKLQQILWALEILMGQLIAVITLIRLGFIREEPKPEAFSAPELDIFIGDIPEQKDEEE